MVALSRNRGNRVMSAVMGVVVVAAGLALWAPRGGAAPPSAEGIEALFSPEDNCEGRIVSELAEATKRIRVQAYLFTSKPIADALAAAKKRGVTVEVVLDKSQEKQTYGRWKVLRRDGVPVWFDGEHEVANNKIILIDDRVVITGSYNFTKAAESKNAENILIIRDQDDVFERFEQNYERHKAHAKKAG